MRLETERLVLRPLEEKDLPDLVANVNNLNVSKRLAVVPFPYTLKDAEWYLNHCLEKAKDARPKGMELVIEFKPEGKVIGAVGLSSIDYEIKSCSFGYWLGEKYWRQGIMSEALLKVMDFAFNELKLNRMEAGVFAENPASAMLLRKLGFKEEGFKRQAIGCKATGKVHDEFIFAMLKEDFLKAGKA